MEKSGHAAVRRCIECRGRRKKQQFRDAEQRQENAADLKTVQGCWNGGCLQNVILDMVNRFGYLGVLILIAVENVFPPIPSEVILTFGGFLTTCTRLHPAGVVVASTAGSLLGALVLYGAGTLVSPESLSELLDSHPMKPLGFHAEDAWKTITWFQKKGQRAVLFGRCIPIIRSLISVPAGMARMEMPKFLLFTIIGSTVWNILLVGTGAAVGAAWEQAAGYVKMYADIVFLVLAAGAACFPAVHLYRKKHK